MVYQDIDKEKTAPILKKYNIRAFPTFVITDAEGVEQARKVGSPFSTPAEAIAWFPKLEDALTNVAAYEAAHKEKPEDVDAGLKLAGAYHTLDKSKEALDLYETFAAKLAKDDKRYVDVQLARANLLLGTMNKDNQNAVLEKIAGIHATVLPDMVKAKDERAISPSILNARIKGVQKKPADGRTELKALAEAFPKSDRLTEIKFWAAQLAAEAGDKEAAKSELQAIVDAGPADNTWVKSAKSALDRLNKASN
ncbi:MAG: hypothetical protein KJ044_14115 [Planctomycetes bacterium]|jgi:hypothetical protein|nr:hypothetical protein [Planctomycetota bacterium]